MATPRTQAPPRRKPSLKFSITGAIYIGMMLFMGLAANSSKANLLFAVFGLMIGVLLVSGIISRLVLRKLELTRTLPEHLIVGRPAAISYQMRNAKRYWPSFSVTVSELDGSEAFTKPLQAYLMHAAAGTTATVPMLVVPKRRGVVQFDRHQLSTSFPFGFIRRSVVRPHTDTVVVYPALAEVDRRWLARCLSAETHGSHMKPRRGGSDEFYGTKEYRPGENPRLINWKRSARTGTLVAREMSTVAPPRILIVLDTAVADDSDASRAQAERAIAMAASLVWTASEQNLAVGLCAASGQECHCVPPNRGKRHCTDLLSLLARLEPAEGIAQSELISQAQRLMHPNTTGVLLTAREAEERGADPARGRWIVLSAASEEARHFFAFDPSIRFEECSPAT